MSDRGAGGGPTQPEACEAAGEDGRDLPGRTGHENHDQHGREGDAGALAVGREIARHSPDGLRDNGHSNHLEPVDQPGADRALEGGRAVGEQHQKQGGGEGERGPGGEGPERAAAHQAERKPDLAARRTGKKLAEGDEIGITRLVDPFSARDQLVPEVSEMRDRAAKRGQAEFQEGGEDLAGGSFRGWPFGI